jgi:hypothetical protein
MDEGPSDGARRHDCRRLIRGAFNGSGERQNVQSVYVLTGIDDRIRGGVATGRTADQ